MTFLREARLSKEPCVIDGFRLRGHEVSRLESFSDAVFGFALTLLIVSLDVPKTFDDLFNTMRGFPAFAVCFLLLSMIWNSHYKFCRRYGLDDTTTRMITLLMLFLVLFYVYPLKFLFNLSLGNMLNETASPLHSTFSQFSILMTIYALGFVAVYGRIHLALPARVAPARCARAKRDRAFRHPPRHLPVSHGHRHGFAGRVPGPISIDGPLERVLLFLAFPDPTRPSHRSSPLAQTIIGADMSGCLQKPPLSR